MANKKIRPADTVEGRESQLIDLAYNLLEKRLMDGTATSQEVTTILKQGFRKSKLERDVLEGQCKLIDAKVKAIESSQHMDAIYEEAMNAMTRYRGENL